MVEAKGARTSRQEQVEQRRAELLEAARQVVLERGLSHTRVADVAAATRVSGGLIHYHFATKDVLLTEMLRHEAERDIAKARRLATGSGSTLQRLDRVMREFVPGSRNDQTWVLWIDAWGASLRDETLRTISQELDTAWNEMLFVVISDGVASGDFITDDPRAVADRLSALLDGLGLRVTLQRPGINRKQMHEHARVVAELELGLDPGSLADAAT
ncbi:MAG TPA: TetR family transcriptional regulator C-terminal domain-containing protein [Actinomycetes bacterium]|nr:TetR family transcriptional regulator C-terminal domain-containing protein [Actinomycetes bacterium]